MITYTIYDHPADFPHHWVVRRNRIGPGEVSQDREVWLFGSLEAARAMIPSTMACIPRDPADEPQIVESWI